MSTSPRPGPARRRATPGPPPELPRHALDVPAPDELPLAVGSFAEIGPLSRADFPHRHTFYELAYVTHGRATHVVDLVAYAVRPPQLFLVTPGQVHHWRDADDLRGHVVLCTPEFLLTDPADRDALHRSGQRSWHPRDAAHAARIRSLLDRMTGERRRAEPGCRSVLRAYLHILIAEVGRSTPAGPAGHPAGDTHAPTGRAVAVARRFDALLAEPALLGEPPRAYARRLGVSVRHLNEAVPRATGATPAQLIRQARVLEAKRLLVQTDLTVARIADRLGFADAAYFCRFFRREVGDTPGGFRRHGGKHHDPGAEHIDADG
ncbi:HTH-type transcriptional activator RhaR [Micromonospora sp. MW-13]|uniref:helix-turn-helix domain-containing protein n=1 Tax=Micromonospora sp. MW-13 TaxID=2094022 RepID=UPI000EE5576A|nr:helix-turn-helix domain-containing protein [Micromonospora sp. MW-13]RGC67115.1 HTH-type transcriptional activator RhaR [Micromonospora sp. MW-13]